MKKIILLCLVIILGCSLTISAQRLSFKNIPIDGNYRDFVASLAEIGLQENTDIQSIDRRISKAFSGDLDDDMNATILVIWNAITEKVWNVTIVINEAYTADELVIVRDMLCENIKKSYKDYEYELDDDGSPTFYLNDDKDMIVVITEEDTAGLGMINLENAPVE